mmetsp:Transcript_9442/g.8982  ORF Transcript_9442/g.8982 Transcript_9442/m.8982 type:complete len:418 (+) Transcript_9442:1180-2433(+)
MSVPSLVSNSESDISVQWSTLSGSNAGDSTILSYELQWDDATGTVSIQLIDSLVTTYTVSGLVPGLTYKFHVAARNIYGYGPYSLELSVEASDVPDQVAIPVVTTVATDVKVDWDAPDSNSNAIDQYEIEFLKSDGSYIFENTNCDGLTPATTECTVAMLTLYADLGLSVDDLIQVRVRAHNDNGWGDYSELNVVGATIEYLPAKMDPPSFDISSSDNGEIDLVWSVPTSGEGTGGSSITIDTYTVEWDQGTTSWTTLGTTATTTMPASSLSSNTDYQFQIKATNLHGDALSFSDPVTIKTGEAPGKPNTPTTTDDGIYVEISWSAPVINSFAVDQYDIEILSSDTFYYNELTYCDGSDATIVTNAACKIPMQVFWDSPFSLSTGVTIAARVKAHNERGWSSVSDDSVGTETVQTVP